MSKKNIISLLIVLALVAITVIGLATGNNRGKSPASNKELESLAQCLTEKGAKFYGAYWCPHCATQKQMFGRAQKQLPYIECAIVGKRDKQTPECEAAGITGYPTWVFADGQKLSGEQKPEVLAKITSCEYTPTTKGSDTVEATGTSPAVPATK